MGITSRYTGFSQFPGNTCRFTVSRTNDVPAVEGFNGIYYGHSRFLPARNTVPPDMIRVGEN